MGEKIKSLPHVGGLATSELPSRRSPTLHSGGQNRKQGTNGRIGYITLAIWGFPNTLGKGKKLEVAHKCVDWLHSRAVWGVPYAVYWADWPYDHRCLEGSSMLLSGGQNQNSVTCGRIG